MTIRPAMLLVTVLLAANACHRTNDTDRLAALESAYKSGLLTKEEYDAKKLAFTTTSPAPAASEAPAPIPAPVPATTQAPTPVATQAPVFTAAETPAPTPNAVPSAPPPKEIPPPAPPSQAVAPPRVSSQAATRTAPPTAALITPSSSPSPAVSPSELPRSETPRNRVDAHEPEPAPLAGCEDAEYKSGGQKGAEERFFAAPPDAVWRAAVSSLDSLDFNIHKSSNKEIEASKKRHVGVIVGAGGERVILILQKAERGGQSGTRVIGETKKNFVGRLAQRTWTDAVLAQIACKLREANR